MHCRAKEAGRQVQNDTKYLQLQQQPKRDLLGHPKERQPPLKGFQQQHKLCNHD
jgi:hypothetical protein